MEEKDGEQPNETIAGGDLGSSVSANNIKSGVSPRKRSIEMEGDAVKLGNWNSIAENSESDVNNYKSTETPTADAPMVEDNVESSLNSKKENGSAEEDEVSKEVSKESNAEEMSNDTNIKSVDCGIPDSEDEMYLKDVSLGFEHEDNLKEPLTGFTELHQAKILPIVEERSMMLYEIVQNMESKQLASDIAAILSHKEPIAVPRSKYLLPGGGNVSMKIINTEYPQKTVAGDDSLLKSEGSGTNEVNFTKERHTLLLKPLNNGWKREIVMRSGGSSGRTSGDVYYYSPENVRLRSSKQVAQYLAKNPSFGMTANNFSFTKGWISQDPAKEIVRNAFDGKFPPMKLKANQKSDISSDSDDSEEDYEVEKVNTKMQLESKSSSSRRSIQPPKRYATGESIFYSDKKTKISTKSSSAHKVSDSMMEMGMLPPKYPKGKEGSNSNSTTPMSLSPDTQQSVRRRGRPPNPGGKKDRLVQAQALAAAQEAAGICNESDDNDSMFQISAFRQSQSLMEAAIEYQQEMQGNMDDSDSEISGNPSLPTVQEDTFGGYNQNAELLPCSIRCAGMTGEMPTLQCRRCLCLYHPECLGLPPNLNFKNFLCSNCEGESPEERISANLPNMNVNAKQGGGEAKKSSQQLQGTKKGGDAKKPPPPPPLIPIHANFCKLPIKMNEMPARLLQPSRLPLLQPSRLPLLQPSPFGRGIPVRQQGDIPKLNLTQLSMLRPVSKDVTMSISPISMKRGRVRPPKNIKLIPQSSRSLTITPISIPKRIPPVPNLLPIGPARMFQKRSNPSGTPGGTPDWLFSKTKQGTIAKAIANIKSSAGGSALSPKFKIREQPQKNMNTKQVPTGFSQILQQQKELKDKGKLGVDSSSPSPPPVAFRKCIQSVVTIGHNQFIVIPQMSSHQLKDQNPQMALQIQATPETREPSPLAKAEPIPVAIPNSEAFPSTSSPPGDIPANSTANANETLVKGESLEESEVIKLLMNELVDLISF